MSIIASELISEVIPDSSIQWGLKKFLWSYQENGGFSPPVLDNMPAGSFGYALNQYYDRNPSLPRPGGVDSLFPAEYLVRHDCHHVLIGASTSQSGEVEVVAFESGLMSESESRILILLSQIQVFCESAGLYFLDASRVYWAYKQGVMVSQSLFEDWDYIADLNSPLAELRSSLGIDALPGSPYG